MTQANDELELYSQILQLVGVDFQPEAILQQHPNVNEILCKADRTLAAAKFGSMLLDEGLQSNCVRIEALVHLSLAVGKGSKPLTQTQLATCFNELDEGICGRIEDPAEDVFVSLVITSQGNFRVLEGIWECGTFYLQRMLNIIETMPNHGAFSMLREGVFALLKLSDAICDRAGLARYSAGAETPRSRVPKTYFSKAKRTDNFFDSMELAQLGIDKNNLDIFTLDDRVLAHLLTEPIADSPLQRYPLLEAGEKIAFVLPTAVSYAIRCAIVDFAFMHDLQKQLQISLTSEYSRLFGNTHLLGSIHRAPIYFSDKEDLPIAEVMTEIDPGRYLHILTFAETFDQFYDTGLAGIDPAPIKNIETIATRLHNAVKHAKKQPGYRDGFVLVQRNVEFRRASVSE